MVLSLFLTALLGQTQTFKETAKVGVPYKIGHYIEQGGRPQDWGNYVNLAFNSARVAMSYPTTKYPVLAEVGSKLLVFNVTITNPSKIAIVLGGDSMPLVSIWDVHGSKAIKLVNYFDPKTKTWPTGQLKKGESANFDIVVSFPAAFKDFRIGFGWERLQTVAWLDLTSKMGKSTSVFAPNGIEVVDEAQAKLGDSFDLGPLAVKLNGALQGDSRKGDAASNKGSVFSITVENTQLVPCRWGWQYIEAFLVMSNGAKVGMYPTLYDATSGAAWIGDLEVGKRTTSQMCFSHDPSLKPVAIEIAWVDTKRKVKINL